MNDQPQLSIIIVNHYADEILPRCLAAIAASDHSVTSEIIIVDNPPGGSIKSITITDKLSVKRIATKGRIGFGAACNLGVSHSNSKYVMFLNPDVILDSSAIRNLFSALTEQPQAGITVGRLTDSGGNFQASCRRFPTLGNLFLSRGSVLFRLLGIRGKSYTLPDYTDITQVESAAAAMMMMSRADFDTLSGFDESFFLYMEDTDLCYRAAKKGMSVFCVPQAGGEHFWGYSTRRYRFRRIIWHHSSIWKYFKRHHLSLPIFIGLAPLLLINCFLSLIAELFTLPQ